MVIILNREIKTLRVPCQSFIKTCAKMWQNEIDCIIQNVINFHYNTLRKTNMMAHVQIKYTLVGWNGDILG